MEDTNKIKVTVINNSNENIDKLNFLRYNTIGKNKEKYFDFTASGLAFRQIENRVHEVLETYANTHSKESSNAKITTKYYKEARDILKHELLEMVACLSSEKIKVVIEKETKEDRTWE